MFLGDSIYSSEELEGGSWGYVYMGLVFFVCLLGDVVGGGRSGLWERGS